MEYLRFAALSPRLETEIKRLECQINQDTHKQIYLVAYEKGKPEEVQAVD